MITKTSEGRFVCSEWGQTLGLWEGVAPLFDTKQKALNYIREKIEDREREKLINKLYDPRQSAEFIISLMERIEVLEDQIAAKGTTK